MQALLRGQEGAVRKVGQHPGRHNGESRDDDGDGDDNEDDFGDQENKFMTDFEKEYV